MKKGRHRRFEEARAFKLRTSPGTDRSDEPCPECDAEPDEEHASWCRATEDDDEGADDGEAPEGAGEPVDQWADDR